MKAVLQDESTEEKGMDFPVRHSENAVVGSPPFIEEDLGRGQNISKRTVERIEAGGSTQMSSMIRVMRVLGLQERLEALVPEAGPRPMELLKLKGKVRKRARAKKKPADEKPWTWGDES